MEQPFEKAYVYKTTLRSVYGLTPRMIRELGEPDKRVKNPHYRSGPLASLYHIERVEAWCQDNQARLDRAAAAREKRSAAARQANATKLREILAWAESVDITLDPPASHDEAWRQAELHYWEQAERHHAGRSWRHDGVTFNGVVAYMRHALTNYESLLHHISGRVGAYEAYQVIRERVDTLVIACLDALLETEV